MNKILRTVLCGLGAFVGTKIILDQLNREKVENVRLDLDWEQEDEEDSANGTEG